MTDTCYTQAGEIMRAKHAHCLHQPPITWASDGDNINTMGTTKQTT
jgi:hypothetical protein